MLDLRSIREDPEPARAALARRGAADVLDEELQRDIDEVAIEVGSSEADRQRDRRDFASGAGGERRRGANDALRQRRGVTDAAAFAQASELVPDAHGVNRITLRASVLQRSCVLRGELATLRPGLTTQRR